MFSDTHVKLDIRSAMACERLPGRLYAGRSVVVQDSLDSCILEHLQSPLLQVRPLKSEIHAVNECDDLRDAGCLREGKTPSCDQRVFQLSSNRATWDDQVRIELEKCSRIQERTGTRTVLIPAARSWFTSS